MAASWLRAEGGRGGLDTALHRASPPGPMTQPVRAVMLAAVSIALVACGTSSSGDLDAADDGATADASGPEIGDEFVPGDAPDAPPAPCRTDEDCDDCRPCNGLERCSDGRCAAGSPPSCDDGIPCSEDVCDDGAGCLHSDGWWRCPRYASCWPSMGGCFWWSELLPTSCPYFGGLHTYCQDGAWCTGPEHCSAGRCEGSWGLRPSCDDDDPATRDVCVNDELGTAGRTRGTGHCLHLPPEPEFPDCCRCGPCSADGDCDDGNACTFDRCDGDGRCRHDSTWCDDDDPCTVDRCEHPDGCVSIRVSDCAW
ncbi:MAG: hypothetical protein HY907_00255 [Deltaproteobacteria bacterium]|nr:hypothetical protein [Deltaproteobacteria bacterium]